MPTSAPTKLPGETWNSFLQRYPAQAARLQAAAQRSTPLTFGGNVLEILGKNGSTEDFTGLFTDFQDMHHQEKSGHEEKHEQAHQQQEHEAETHDAAHDMSAKGVEAGVGIFSFFIKPKFMEEDPKFWKLVEEERKIWKKENPEPKENASKEEKLAYEQKQIDAEYGSLDDPDSTSFETLASEKFKKEYGQEEALAANKIEDGKPKKPIDQKKLAKWNKYQTYRTTPLSFDKDKEVHHVKTKIEREAAARLLLLKKSGLKGTDLDQSYKAVMERIRQKHWEEFAATHAKKAEAYVKEQQPASAKATAGKEDFEAFKKAHAAILKKEAQKAEQEKVPQAPPKSEHSPLEIPQTTTPALAPIPPNPLTPSTPPHLQRKLPPVLSPEEQFQQRFEQMKKESEHRKTEGTTIPPSPRPKVTIAPQSTPPHPSLPIRIAFYKFPPL